MSTEAKFLTGSPLRHVIVMSATSSVGLMAVFVVDLVDMLFISMLGQAELAAAIGYAGAILFLTTSVSIAMAIAAGALVARNLGAGDEERARQLATHVMVYGFVLSVVFASIVWINIETLAALMGAEGETLRLASMYLSIIIPSMPLLMLGMAGSAVLRAHGDARRSMLATVGGGLVNAVLDPILIFGLNLDLAGAALASVAARVAIMVLALWPVVRIYKGLAPFKMSAFAKDLPAITNLAAPAMMTNLATPIGSAYVTRAMAEFGEAAVAGMAIVGRLTPVSFALIFALSGAVGPIIGQNFGAKLMDRVRETFKDALVFTGLYVLFAALLLFLLRAPIADMFGATGETRELVYLFCGPLALAWFFNGVIFVGNAGFNNLGHPLYSTGINWGRNTLGTIPFVAAGAALFGAPGVLIGQAAGGVIFAGLSQFFAQRLLRQISSGEVEHKERPHFSRRARLLQLFEHRR
ncbi:MAG: MATE family efflux transporter [Pseudomonadota bacterium]